MDGILDAAVRRFVSQNHIRNVMKGEWVDLFNEKRERLVGIRGRMGVNATGVDGTEIGIDFMEMQPGSGFPLHSHFGDHIIYIISGIVTVRIDFDDYALSAGDTIFIPAEHPHAFRVNSESLEGCSFLAIGHPHRLLSSEERMQLVE